MHKAADQPLRDAMDLASLTEQHPADTLALDERDIRDGAPEVQQGKTVKRLRFTIEGILETVLSRIQARKAGYRVTSTRLIVNENGEALRSRFDRALCPQPPRRQNRSRKIVFAEQGHNCGAKKKRLTLL